MRSSPVELRRATCADATDIADVFAASCRHAYQDILPPSRLAKYVPGIQIPRWTAHFDALPPGHRITVACQEESVIGFLETRHNPPTGEHATIGGIAVEGASVGEVTYLFVDPRCIGTGVGRLLLAEGRNRSPRRAWIRRSCGCSATTCPPAPFTNGRGGRTPDTSNSTPACRRRDSPCGNGCTTRSSTSHCGKDVDRTDQPAPRGPRLGGSLLFRPASTTQPTAGTPVTARDVWRSVGKRDHNSPLSDCRTTWGPGLQLDRHLRRQPA